MPLGPTGRRTSPGAGGGGVTHQDDTVFVPGTDQVTPIGGFLDDVAPDSVDEGDVGAVRMSANRSLHVEIRDGANNERAANVDDNSRLETNIDRRSVIADATILIGANLSDEQDMRRYGSGNVYIPAVWTPADIGFHVAHTTGGTFVPLYDDNGNIVQMTVGAVTDRAVAFPPEIFAVRYFKFWSQNAGVDQNQAAERDLDYELKA